jgi:hypothetical protein
MCPPPLTGLDLGGADLYRHLLVIALIWPTTLPTVPPLPSVAPRPTIPRPSHRPASPIRRTSSNHPTTLPPSRHSHPSLLTHTILHRSGTDESHMHRRCSPSCERQGYDVPLYHALRAATDKHGLAVRTVAYQLLHCVDALHETCGVVHCDLKREHFLQFGGGSYRLIDCAPTSAIATAIRLGHTPSPLAPTPAPPAPCASRASYLCAGHLRGRPLAVAVYVHASRRERGVCACVSLRGRRRVMRRAR